MQQPLRLLVTILALVLLAGACRAVEPVPATPEAPRGPIRLALPAGTRPDLVNAHGAPLAQLLARESGLRVTVSVPSSPETAVDALGSGNVDAAWLSPFAYVVAHDRWAADALVGTTRGSRSDQTGQLELPATGGKATTTRRLPGPIPRDALAVHASLSVATREAFGTALLRVADSEEGRTHLMALLAADGLIARTDADFDRLRAMLRALDLSTEQVIEPRRWRAD